MKSGDLSRFLLGFRAGEDPSQVLHECKSLNYDPQATSGASLACAHLDSAFVFLQSKSHGVAAQRLWSGSDYCDRSKITMLRKLVSISAPRLETSVATGQILCIEQETKVKLVL